MEKKKAAALTGVAGLNAAAIIFLFTHFVPRHEFEAAVARAEKMEERVAVQSEQIAVLKALAVGARFE